MKKIILMLLSFTLLFTIGGCSKTERTFWKEEDFSFYDADGKERVFPTAEDYWIDLEDSDGLRTYRGVEIGDRASNLSEIYDLTDFEYSICDFSYINPETEESEELEEKYIAEGKTVMDILNLLPEISGKDLGVYLSCDVYEIDGKLCTQSQVGKISEADVRDFFDLRDDVDVSEELMRMYRHRMIKYSISFSIEYEKIIDVSVNSNYHNWLNAG